jgi:replication-associated recombination protein RarA
MKLFTRKKYDFYVASSAMQKAIRRGDIKVAGFFALELFHSNYIDYVWKRLFTISAEDCWGLITGEVQALYNGFQMVNKGNKKEPKGRIFISKAVILLCECKKSRDSDHLQNLIYDKMDITEEEINQYIDELEDWEKKIEVPEYAYDVHTMQGKRNGKTKEEFFKDEQEALNNKQIGIFDYLIK